MEHGKRLPKRIKMVDQRGCSCKFQFTVKWFIDVCFFVDLRQCSGCPVHQSHPRFIDPTTVPLPTRLLTSDQIDNIVHIVNAMSNNGTARNYLHGKFGKFINLMKAAYLCRRANGDLNSPNNDIVLMMDNLVTSNKISFMSILDVTTSTPQIILSLSLPQNLLVDR